MPEENMHCYNDHCKKEEEGGLEKQELSRAAIHMASHKHNRNEIQAESGLYISHNDPYKVVCGILFLWPFQMWQGPPGIHMAPGKNACSRVLPILDLIITNRWKKWQ